MVGYQHLLAGEAVTGPAPAPHCAAQAKLIPILLLMISHNTFLGGFIWSHGDQAFLGRNPRFHMEMCKHVSDA